MSRTTLAHTGQPAVKAALAFALGIFLSHQIPLPLSVPFFAGAILLAALFFLHFPSSRARVPETAIFVLFLLLLSATGWFWSAFRESRDPVSPRWMEEIPRAVTLVGRVAQEPVQGNGRVTIILDPDSIRAGSRSFPLSGLLLATEYPDGASFLRTLSAGDLVILTGKLRLPDGPRNPGEFDYRAYLRARGIDHTFTLAAGGEARILKREPPSAWVRSLIAARAFLRARIDAHFPPDQAAFVRGLVIGDRAMIGPQIQEAFVRAGVVHVLSISGLHVGMICVILLALFSRLPLSIRVCCTIACLLFYQFLTGGDPPVVRAVLMSAVYLVGLLTQRQLSQMNNLAVAALVILVLSPLELFMIGFQLSFAGVFSLLVFYPRLGRVMRRVPPALLKLPLVPAILQTLLLTFAAQLGTTPILLFHFAQLSIVAPAANLLVVPGTFAILSLALSAIFTTDLCTPVAALYAAAGRAAVSGTIGATQFLASMPLAAADLRRLTIAESAIAILVLLYLFHGARRTRMFRLLAVALGGLLLLVCSAARSALFPETPVLRVTLLDVGQGDAIDLALPGGEHALIDTGPAGRRSDAGARVILPYYKRMGIARLKALILTHPDADHIGGASSLLRAMRIERLVVSTAFAGGPEADSLLRAAELAGIRVERRASGDTLSIDPRVRLYLLHPPARFVPAPAGGEESPSNQASLVLRLVYGATSFFLAADLPESREIGLIRAFGHFLRSDVLKVGHHGSASSTSPELLRCLHPDLALISCGRFNRFRHPRPELLARLKAALVPARRSDSEGAILLESDGRSIRSVEWR